MLQTLSVLWRTRLFRCLLVVFGFAALLGCNMQVESRSESLPLADRYSSARRVIDLKPSGAQASVPNAHLWYVHTDPIKQSCTGSERNVGKAWTRIEARFLLPDFLERSPDIEEKFRERDGENVMSLMVMSQYQYDGDVRKHWRRVRLEWDPACPTTKVAVEASKAAGAYVAPLLKRHENLGLDEYEGKGEYPSQFFVSGETIIACGWMFLLPRKYFCESSVGFPNGLLVTWSYPYSHLSRWREIEAFSLRIAESYLGGSLSKVR